MKQLMRCPRGLTEEEKKNGPSSNERMELFRQLKETSNGATPLDTELHIPATACMNRPLSVDCSRVSATAVFIVAAVLEMLRWLLMLLLLLLLLLPSPLLLLLLLPSPLLLLLLLSSP